MIKSTACIVMLSLIHISMGSHILFQCDDVLPELVIGVEICEDVWTPNPPSISHALAGATLIVNLSASDETTGKDIYRRELVAGQSARLLCGYIYASAGDGESTQDVVYSGHNIIAENGVVLAESERFTNETVYSEIDMERLVSERRRMSTFAAGSRSEDYPVSYTHLVIVLTVEANEDGAGEEAVHGGRIKKAFLNILKNPIILGIAFGMVAALLSLDFPTMVDKTIDNVAKMATPLALIALGAGFEDVYKRQVEGDQPKGKTF